MSRFRRFFAPAGSGLDEGGPLRALARAWELLAALCVAAGGRDWAAGPVLLWDGWYSSSDLRDGSEGVEGV